MSERMTANLGGTVLVDNVAGAGGSIGVGKVARSAPDGYTLGIGQWSHYVLNGATYALQYDLLADFAPVALIVTGPMLIVSRKDLPANDMKGLIAWLKANPDKATAGTGGVGAPGHISGIFFQKLTDTRFQFVPYRGTAPAMRDLLAGQIDIMLDQASNVLPQTARRHHQGLRRHRQGAAGFGARGTDRRRSGPARPACLGVAWPVGAQGHGARHHRQAERRRREVAGRARHQGEARRAGAGHPTRRPAHAAGAGRLAEGGDREMVAHRQSRGDQRRMKLGVLQFFSWPGRRGPLEDVYARALERIEIMDRTGFDAVWLAEHHFTTFSVCPSVHMLGILAAARTKRLRIGTAVSLAALYHPLRLAEEVALLDMLSGGRVNWGAGRGFAHFEFKHFGVPAEESAERFREAVEIVLKAWTEERFTFKGTALLLRRCRGAAQAPAAAARRPGWRRPRKAPSTGRRAAAFPS